MLVSDSTILGAYNLFKRTADSPFSDFQYPITRSGPKISPPNCVFDFVLTPNGSNKKSDKFGQVPTMLFWYLNMFYRTYKKITSAYLGIFEKKFFEKAWPLLFLSLEKLDYRLKTVFLNLFYRFSEHISIFYVNTSKVQYE